MSVGGGSPPASPVGAGGARRRRRHGRPRTGSVEPVVPSRLNADGTTTSFSARIRLDDGSRTRVDVPEKYSAPAGGLSGRQRAELYAEARQEREDETGELLAEKRARGAAAAALAAPPPPPAELGPTVSTWYGDYHKAAERGAVGRKNRGRPQSSIGDRRGRFRLWIEPVIGPLPMKAITAADLRRVVQRLDEQIRARASFYESGEEQPRGRRRPGMSAKTAQNVWSEITNGFAEALSSKIDALRVIDVNPAIGVLPPATADDREQAALFPSEVIALLSCEAVPLWRRRLYAVAIYTGMRRSELARLDVGDIDMEHEIIRVRGKKTVAAKRTIPIEPALQPLLEVLVAGRESGLLLAVPRGDGKGGSSDLVKKDLVRARLARADLTRDDAEHMPFTFHGLRHTCITHWTVAGRDQLFLLTAGGHTDVEMTKRYLAAASSLSAKFGQPHPPLPAGAGLLEEPVQTPVQASGKSPAISPARGVGQKQSGQPVEVARFSHVTIVTPTGIEGYVHTTTSDDSSALASSEPTRVDVSPRTEVARGPSAGPPALVPAASAVEGADMVRLAAKARIVEQLSDGDVRVLAGELRAELERLAGPSAAVVSLHTNRRRGG